MTGDNKCSECKVAYKHYYDLRKHVKEFHQEKLDQIAPLKKHCSRDNKCSECKVVFKHFKNLRKHVKKFHQEKLDQIAPLKKRCENNATLEKMSGDNKCSECKVVFKHFKNLRKHVMKFHQEKLDQIAPLKKRCENNATLEKMSGDNKCSECKVVFKHFKNLRKHVMKFHQEKLDQIAPLKKRCENNATLEKMSGDNKCSECKVVFKHFKNLRKHVMKFHQEKLDQIAPLKKRCENNATLEKMSGDSKCSECKVVFKHFKNLRKHVKKFHQVKLDEIAPLKKRCGNNATLGKMSGDNKYSNVDNKCSECKVVFKHFYYLRKHVKKFHQEKLDEIAPLKKRCENHTFRCEICEKTFKYKRHLTFHKKNHGVINDSSNKTGKKKCPLCSFHESSKTQLLKHFSENHNIEMSFENLVFSTKEGFDMWKNSIEQSSKTQFFKEQGDAVYKTHKTINYICNRSGVYTSEGQKKRQLKKQGSRKIGGFCPSGMKVLINLNGQYQVSYTKTHVGHTTDLCHLNLTTAERKEIASKIASKIPFCNILDEVRDKVSSDSVQRIHLLNRQDLYNVSTSFNLKSEAVQHPDDVISIEAWVNDMQNSQCVLFYKPQDLALTEHPELKCEDFVLIIMNESQSQALQKFSSDCVCIDGTHGLNACNFELHTLLVLDDLRQGFPTAFLISNRSDEEVMTLFFSCIKEKIGFNISPKIFMSDMVDAYYNAWIRVMNAPEMRLFCTWHVDRAWRKNLSSINIKDKQVELYKNLQTLLQETDQTDFLAMLEDFLNKYSEDPDTSQFTVYFRENYTKNVESWAYCYRPYNTNMHLERMYKTLEHFERKHIKRLDKSIMRFVKDNLFERITARKRGKLVSKIKETRKRHKQSLELDVNSINEVNDGWEPGIDENHSLHIIHIDPRNAETQELHMCLATTGSIDPLNDKALEQEKEELKSWFCTVVDSIQSESHFDAVKKFVAPLEPTLKALVFKDSLKINTVLLPHNKKANFTKKEQENKYALMLNVTMP